MGILLIVSVIVAALFMAGTGTYIADRVEELICRIGGGHCAEVAGENLEPCLLASSEDKSSAKLFVGFVEVGKSSILIREDFSDGTTKFTLVDSSELKAELFAGATARVGDFGVSAAAQAAAGGRLKGAQVFEVPTSKADDFAESVSAAGGFDGLLRDAAQLNDHSIGPIPVPFGLPNPLGKLDDLALDVLGVDKDDPNTDPTEEYIDVSAIVGVNGEAGAPGADVKGMAEGAAGAKVIHEGKRSGETELYYQFKGDVGGSLSDGMFGVNLGGEATFVATLVVGKDGKPKTLKVSGAAGYTGGLETGDSLEGKDAAAMHKSLEKLALSATAGTGKAIEVGGELDLSDPANLALALQFLTPNPSGAQAGAVPGLVDAFYRDGKLSVDFFDVDKDKFDGEVKVGLGIGGGGGGGQESQDKTATGSFVRLPGGRFEEKKCKQ